jgi:hypothetical protein
MTTRNRTSKFVDIRNAAKANRSLNRFSEKDELSDSGLLVCWAKNFQLSKLFIQQDNHTQWKAAKDSLPPRWVDSIERAEEDIEQIQIKSMYDILPIIFT